MSLFTDVTSNLLKQNKLFKYEAIEQFKLFSVLSCRISQKVRLKTSVLDTSDENSLPSSNQLIKIKSSRVKQISLCEIHWVSIQCKIVSVLKEPIA